LSAVVIARRAFEPLPIITTRSGHNLAVRYRLEGNVLSTTRYELSCDDELVHVEPQVFDVLDHVVAAAWSRGRSAGCRWGHQFVAESALTSPDQAAPPGGR
jgi:hypothetical protein